MIGIVQSVEEVFVERMNILQAGETVEDCLEFLCKSFGGVLDFSSVETWDFVRLEISSPL